MLHFTAHTSHTLLTHFSHTSHTLHTHFSHTSHTLRTRAAHAVLASLAVTSATLASEAKSSTLVDVKIAVGGITATCSLDWSLWFGDLDANQHPSKKDCDKWLVFCGAGSAQVTAKNVGLQTKFGIESTDFASRPPRKATVEDLDLQIAFSIDKLEGTLSTFWSMIKGAFGDEITKLVSREVTAAVDGDVQVLIGDLLTELLANVTALVDPYLAPRPPLGTLPTRLQWRAPCRPEKPQASTPGTSTGPSWTPSSSSSRTN